MLEHNLNILEYVEVTVTITHRRRGDLRIEFVCPTRDHLSVLAPPRHRASDSYVHTMNRIASGNFLSSTVGCF